MSQSADNFKRHGRTYTQASIAYGQNECPVEPRLPGSICRNPLLLYLSDGDAMIPQIPGDVGQCLHRRTRHHHNDVTDLGFCDDVDKSIVTMSFDLDLWHWTTFKITSSLLVAA